jgi:AcrR family transcriptional regulator
MGPFESQTSVACKVKSNLFSDTVCDMTMAAEPRTAKGRATRQRLLACAHDVSIANDGHLEIAWVAEAAGVVPSLVNRYFGSRSGLLSALIDDFFERLRVEVLDVNLEDQGTWAQHERLRLEKGVRFHYAHPAAVVIYTRLSREPEVAATENGHIAMIIKHAAANIRRGQKRGELPTSVDPELAGAAMFGAMQRVMVAALGRTPRPRPDRVTEILWRQIAAAVEIEPYAEIDPPRRRHRWVPTTST